MGGDRCVTLELRRLRKWKKGGWIEKEQVENGSSDSAAISISFSEC